MIEIGKQYRTRDGREVRIYAVDGGEDFPVHGAICVRPNEWRLECWPSNGVYRGAVGRFDLIEVKPKITRTFWIKHYTTGAQMIYAEDRKRLDAYDNRDCIGITGPHEITFEEGDGL